MGRVVRNFYRENEPQITPSFNFCACLHRLTTMRNKKSFIWNSKCLTVWIAYWIRTNTPLLSNFWKMLAYLLTWMGDLINFSNYRIVVISVYKIFYFRFHLQCLCFRMFNSNDNNEIWTQICGFVSLFPCVPHLSLIFSLSVLEKRRILSVFSILFKKKQMKTQKSDVEFVVYVIVDLTIR